MKYILKGFIKIPTFANNAVNALSALGEMSDESYSYAREKGFYQHADKPNVELISFTSMMQDGEKIEVPAKYSTHVLEISQWIFEQSIAALISDDSESFRRLLLAQFPSIAELEVGEMEVTRGNWLPTYMTWKLTTDDLADNSIRVWFADAAFAAQYDDYEIIVIPPITPVDTFQKIRTEVIKALSKFNLPDHHQSVLAATGNFPYTFLLTNIYKWVDREEVTFTLDTNWSVAIYGIAGKNPALIKQAIADWILANSTYTKDDWIIVFPDIFTSTEFTIVPLWQNTSVVDETARGSLYSPLVSYNSVLELAKKFIEYPKAGHVEKYLLISGVQFKSLSFISCGGNENRGKQFSIRDIFPDYAIIPTNSVDFNRMSKKTTLWIMKLIEAIIAAEEMDEYSYIGAGLARVSRAGRYYIAFEYDNFLYLVLSRKSMLAALVPSEVTL